MIREIKQTFTFFSESRFRNLKSDLRIVTITQHSNHYLSVSESFFLFENQFRILSIFLANRSSSPTFAIRTMTRQEAQKRADPEIAKAKILKIKQRLQELRQRRAQKETIEAARSISTSRDIDIFDSTLICDIQKFELYSHVTDFLQHLEQCQHQYRKSDVLDLLFKCFRDSAFAWYKTQSDFIFLQNFDKSLVNAFFISIEPEAIQSTSSISSSTSSQYHLCVECFAPFSSMTRFLEHIKQVSCSKVICKHCEQSFNFKNKFHDHIREHHAQKFVTSFVTSKNSDLRVSTSEFTYKIMKKSAVACSSVSLASSIFSATSTFISESISSKDSHLSIASLDITSKQTKIAAMLITREFTSKRVEIATFNCSFVSSFIFSATPKSIFCSASISSKCSHFSIATLNITSKSMKKLSINCSFTFSTSFFSTSSRTPVSEHQKLYLTIDDLIRMFREKSRSFDLRQHQKNFAFSQSDDTRSFVTYQSRIIVYFLPTTNQKTSISQISKSSKSKISKQYMFAKSTRTAFNNDFFEKSIISSYKKSNIFYISLQSRFFSRFSFAWFRFTSSFTFSSFFRSLTSDHVCCICFDHFNFRNDLFNYSSSSQSYFSNRRSMRKVKKMISRFETKLRENER